MELPQGFLEQISDFGPSLSAALAEALRSSEAVVSVRANLSKGIAPPAGAARVPWCGQGWYLDGRPAFTFDPAMHQGLYYVQDASSMIVSGVVSQILSLREDPSAPLCCLDACAAPGGKATAIVDALPKGSLLVANEYVTSRAAILAENLSKWGRASVVVSRGDTARFRSLAGMFDIVSADVPCSGEGMFRKDAEAVAQWSPQLVAECARRQRRIVDDLWVSLRPGGFMIYSTCTFNRQENELVVSYMVDELGALPQPLDFPDAWGVAGGISTQYPCFRFFPHMVRGEGLFLALLRKPPDALRPLSQGGRQKNSIDRPPASLRSALEGWMSAAEEYSLLTGGESVYAFPAAWSHLLPRLESALDLVQCGTQLAAVKGRDLVPSHSLALSTLLEDSAFPVVGLDYPSAIAYLRRETLTLGGAPRGYLLVSYGGRPLGFVKNLGNRANNLYPVSWRILSRHVPGTPPAILNR